MVLEGRVLIALRAEAVCEVDAVDVVAPRALRVNSEKQDQQHRRHHPALWNALHWRINSNTVQARGKR